MVDDDPAFGSGLNGKVPGRDARVGEDDVVIECPADGNGEFFNLMEVDMDAATRQDFDNQFCHESAPMNFFIKASDISLLTPSRVSSMIMHWEFLVVSAIFNTTSFSDGYFL